MKPKLLLISHGFLAKEALSSAELIAGKIENAFYVDVLPSDGREEIKVKVDKTLAEITQDDSPVLIIVDLYGGTPGNIAVMSAGKSELIKIVSGLNLAMLIAYAFSDSGLEELAKEVEEAGLEGIKSISILNTDSDQDDDEIEID